MKIAASMVRELREQTGLGMMDCKQALAENGGDFAQAHDWLRKRGAAAAGRKSDRAATEGCIAASIAGDCGALVRVNSETDFVARNSGFAKFAQAFADAACAAGRQPDDAGSLATPDGTVEELRVAAAMQLGENIRLGPVQTIAAKGKLHSYVHHDGSIGVIADVSGDDQIGRDVCLHIAAMTPTCLAAEDVPEQDVAREREIYAAQAAASGKPAEVANKIVEGKVRKFLASAALLGQPFVKNPDLPVGKYLAQHNAEAHGFIMLNLATAA